MMENEIYQNSVDSNDEEFVTTLQLDHSVEIPQEEKKSFTDMLKGLADKGKELLNNPQTLVDKLKAIPQKIWIMIGGGVAALIAIIVVLSLLGNTYKTPIKAVENLLSSKSVNQAINRVPAVLNGFGEKDAKALITIAKKSDMYKDNKEDIEDGFDELIELLEENVGRNYKIKLKVVDKDKLDKDDVKAFRNQLRNIGDMKENLEDLDKDDIEDMADEVGLSKAQFKKAIKIAKSFCKDCDKAKVKKGYELTVEVKITGRELDEPMEMEIPINVFKVDGRWVMDVFSLAENAGSLIAGAVMGGMMGGFGGMSGLLGGF